MPHEQTPGKRPNVEPGLPAGDIAAPGSEIAHLARRAAAAVNPKEAPDLARRQLLQWVTTGTAVVGAGFAAVPFIESWEPSERARAEGSPIDVNISDLNAGTLRVVIWQRQPIYVVRRTPQVISELPKNDSELRDPLSHESTQPGYADNIYRSRRPEILVVIGICTHLGCLPKARFEPGDPTLGTRWPGGFYCPCHGSTYDMAGRVFRDVPAPRNLAVPPYAYTNDGALRVGVDSAERATG